MIQSKHATLRELETHYSVEDMWDFIEMLDIELAMEREQEKKK